MRERERKVVEQARLKRIGIPPLFYRATFRNYIATTPAQELNLKWAEDFAGQVERRPRSGMLLGNAGTGKTHLAVAIARVAAERIPPLFCEATVESLELVHYARVDQVARRVKDTWGRRGSSEGEILAHLAAVRLLVLDEVGTIGSSFERDLLFPILDDRYAAERPTLIVSNLGTQAVSDFLGARVIDRFREHGADVRVFDWDSYRVKEAGSNV